MSTIPIKDAQAWESEVIQSDVPVFVDFWAEWCGPCRMVSPVVEELASDYDGKVKFVKVNIDEAGELAGRYKVYSIPTLVLFNKGSEITRQSGSASKDSFKNMIDRSLAPA